MNIVTKKLSELVPYENNPRKNGGAVESVANSIKEFGFKVPIIVDKDNVIVAGHTRYLASKELGLEEVPCIVADDLTETQVKAFRIAENKTNDLAEWDADLLSEELNSIIGDIDMTDFGFGEFELTMLTEDMSPEGYDDEMIEKYAGVSDNLFKMKRIVVQYGTEEEEAFLEEHLGITIGDRVSFYTSGIINGDYK